MTMHPLTRYRRDRKLTLEALASAVGVGRAALCKWEKRRHPDYVPVAQVITLESVTGIPRSQLRPDLYPPSADPASDVDRSCVRPSEAAPSEPCEAAE